MRNILDIGKQGNERLDAAVSAVANADIKAIEGLAAVIERFPGQKIDAETADGIKKSIGVRSLLLANVKVFELAHRIAAYEPLVYAQVGDRRVMGMMSANYDHEGQVRLPFIKIIPLETPYPLTSRLLPDARMATMLAGAVSAERYGVGGHEGAVSNDFEHRATMYGAISLGDPEIARSHANHGVRKTASLATGLTNGSLGNLFEPDKGSSDFPGYGQPLIIRPGEQGILFLPDSFIGHADGYGVTYQDAPRTMLGAGLQLLYERRGAEVSRQIQTLSGEL